MTDDRFKALVTLGCTAVLGGGSVLAALLWGVPSLINRHDDAGTIGAGLLALGSIVSAAFLARFVVTSFRELTQGEDDEDA
jgi:hypothetical protein